jgi:hypothetical protein
MKQLRALPAERLIAGVSGPETLAALTAGHIVSPTSPPAGPSSVPTP